jgi:hypothetical protein
MEKKLWRAGHGDLKPKWQREAERYIQMAEREAEAAENEDG